MEQFSLLNIGILIGAWLLHVILTTQAAMKKKGTSFMFGKWITENWISGAASLLSAFLLMACTKDIAGAFGIQNPDGTYFYQLSALLFGFLNWSVFHAIIKWGKAKFGSK